MRQFTAMIMSFVLLTFNFAVGEFLWSPGSALAADAYTGSYEVKDVPAEDSEAVESAMNQSMILMLAAVGVAAYAEYSCRIMSVHIYAATAAAFVAAYLFKIKSAHDDIDDILDRYKNFNFSTSTELTGSNRDMQIEAYKTCQEENKLVADTLRDIAIIHYLVAAGFAVAAGWAFIAESSKAGCELGLHCNGFCYPDKINPVTGERLPVDEKGNVIQSPAAKPPASAAAGARPSAAAGAASRSPTRPGVPSTKRGEDFWKFPSSSIIITQNTSPESEFLFFMQNQAVVSMQQSTFIERLLEIVLTKAKAEETGGLTSGDTGTGVVSGNNSQASNIANKIGTNADPTSTTVTEPPANAVEAAQHAAGGDTPPVTSPETTAPSGPPQTEPPAPKPKDDNKLLDTYWVRGLIFAGFALFAYYVGMQYDENADIYDARAAACGELKTKLEESSAETPGVIFEEGSGTGIGRLHLPAAADYQLVANFFAGLFLSSAQANKMPNLANRTCFLDRKGQAYPDLISCEKCTQGARCKQPTVLQGYPLKKNNMPASFNESILALGEYEKFLYSGQHDEADGVAKDGASLKNGVKKDLEKIIKHYQPQMVAQGAPNLPYEQLMAMYQEKVKKMGEDYFHKLTPTQQKDFLQKFTLRLPSMNFRKTNSLEVSDQQNLSSAEQQWLATQPIGTVTSPGPGTVPDQRSTEQQAAMKDAETLGKDLNQLYNRGDINEKKDDSLFGIISLRYLKSFFGI